jgi:hypothetical protein
VPNRVSGDNCELFKMLQVLNKVCWALLGWVCRTLILVRDLCSETRVQNSEDGKLDKNVDRFERNGTECRQGAHLYLSYGGGVP